MLVLSDLSQFKTALTPRSKDHLWAQGQTLCGREVPRGTGFGSISLWDELQPARRCKRCDAIWAKVRAMQSGDSVRHAG